MVKHRRIECVNTKTKDILVFDSIATLMSKGFPKTCVYRVLNGTKKDYNGFTFRYV